MKNYYVYLLTDPRRNNEVFYCGKGTGDRWKSHLDHWSGNGKNNPTDNKIKQIQKTGLQPGVIFLHENIEDENYAYQLEEDYIRQHIDTLTNLKIEAKPPDATGRSPWNKGKKMPAHIGESISRSLTGKKRGPYSEAHCKAISKSLQRDKHPMWGKPAKNCKAIIETTTNTIFSDQLTAARTLGVRQGDIANCLAQRQKSVKGFKFVFAK
jgi:hypothetical protein